MIFAARERPLINLKSVALPSSHGGWGFLLEPILLGLLVAPSVAGIGLGVAATGAFLMQQPLKLWLTDWQRQRVYPRTVWAGRFLLAYGLVAMLGFVLAVSTASAAFWLPIVLAAPLAIIQLQFDIRHQGRALWPELAGATALGATASAIALAVGWSLAPALGLWLVLTVRAVTSIVYVRAKLRFERGEAVARREIIGQHVGGLLLLASVAFWQIIPWLAVVGMAALLYRAKVGLCLHERPVPAKVVGFWELGLGVLMVVLTAIGIWGGW